MLVMIFSKLCARYLCSEVVAGLFRTAVILKISQDSQDTQMIVLPFYRLTNSQYLLKNEYEFGKSF